MITVAIASEFQAYDGELYRYLLERLLGVSVQSWKSEWEFNGCNHVRQQAGLYLQQAAQQGVQHALVAIDNDGGGKRGLPHRLDHDISREVSDPDGCRVCWLHHAIPASWRAQPYRSCVVVPTQTLETWLLVLKVHPFKEPSPEQRYDRSMLKKDIFSKPLPSSQERTRIALELLRQPDALERLSLRPSFQLFMSQVLTW